VTPATANPSSGSLRAALALGAAGAALWAAALSLAGAGAAPASSARAAGAGPPPALAPPAPPAPPGRGPDCTRTAVAMTPLSDLGRRRYRGYLGGLYARGANRPPRRYLRAGLAQARRVVALGPDGRPNAAGKVVLLSAGMSNANIEFDAFRARVGTAPRVNPRLVAVNGAQGGRDAESVVRDPAGYLAASDQRLRAAGVTPAQVQVVWLKEAIANEAHLPGAGSFPGDARRLSDDLRAIVALLGAHYPNLRLVYLASRTYAGYASSPLNPEPFAYDSAFAVKWAIQARMAPRARGPWLGWGPYLWTDGVRGRRDGLRWTCADVGPDGTHPSASGAAKVAGLLVAFFTTDRTARPWFTGAG